MDRKNEPMLLALLQETSDSSESESEDLSEAYITYDEVEEELSQYSLYTNGSITSTSTQSPPIRNGNATTVVYRCARQFFISQILKYFTSITDPKIGGHLLRVKLLYWSDPNTIYIVPDCHDYFQSHVKFRDTLDQYVSRYRYENDSSTIYKHGDCCYVKNNGDPRLGVWLRGVVEKKSNLKVSKSNGSHSKSISLKADQILYQIRLIDFGFEWIKAAKEMRLVKDMKLFRSKGTWALKCKLYGTFPNEFASHKRSGLGFSSICLEMMDNWIRERMEYDSERWGSFYVAFQDHLKCNHKHYTRPLPTIRLFHRFESAEEYEKLDLANELERLSCLNTYLVENSYASQWDPKTGKNSEILLSQTFETMVVSDYS